MHRRIPADATPVEIIIDSVAAVTDRDPIDLEPLADKFDPDAIDGLFSGPGNRDSIELSLEYEGCRITIDSRSVQVVEQPPIRSTN